jgi:tetratricopeptide (TPR) repeat protein
MLVGPEDRPADDRPREGEVEGLVRGVLRIDAGQAVWQAEDTVAAGPIAGLDHALDEALWRLEREIQLGSPTAAVVDRDSRLHTLQIEAGLALARCFLPENVAAALRADLALAHSSHGRLSVGLEIAGPFEGLPWETLDLDGSPLALHPRVELYRRGAAGLNLPLPRFPRPLRILVAIGSPERQNACGELLDMEAELDRILAALEPARRLDRPAHVKVLEFGTLAAIAQAVAGEDFHVLHLTCHAGPGLMALEDADGGEDRVDVQRLAAALQAGKDTPLVFLGGCSTALEPDPEASQPLRGLASGLLELGIPAVVATRALIGDPYATAFAAAFYRELAAEGRPARAFDRTRKELEQRRREGAATRIRAEWSTPLLFLGAGLDEASPSLFDPAAPAAAIREPQTFRFAAGTLERRVGEFVGRRGNQREILRRLRAPEVGGVVVRGLGGLGKSSLAAQIAQKVRGDFRIVSFFGELDPETILDRTGRALAADEGNSPGLTILAEKTRRSNVDPFVRLKTLLREMPSDQPILLLLDNFEDNLTPLDRGATAFRNADLKAFLEQWLEGAGGSRVLFTCRYCLPLALSRPDRLLDHPLGPLSFAETRKLIWRLPAIDRLPEPEQRAIWAKVGGHPRALEYLDALLHHGRAVYPEVAERLEQALAAKGLGDLTTFAAARGGSLAAAIAETITLAADDVLLSELLEVFRARPLAQRLLRGASVYRRPVPKLALVWQTSQEVPPPPDDLEPAEPPEGPPPPIFQSALAKIRNLGLIAPAVAPEPGHLCVPRWTASRILERATGPELAESHRRAAVFWRWQIAATPLDQRREIVAHLEARHHHFEAGERDLAIEMTHLACSILHPAGAYFREKRLLAATLGWAEKGSTTEAALLHRLGLAEQIQGSFDRAREHFENAVRNYGRRGELAAVSASLYQLGLLAHSKGDIDSAFDFFERAFAIQEDLGDLTGMAISYHMRGILELEIGDYEEALKFTRKSIELQEKLDDREGLSASYHQLGRIASDQGDLQKAEEHYRQSLELKGVLDDRLGQAISLHQLGVVAQLRGDLRHALAHYRESLAIKEELGYREGMANTTYQLGRVADLAGEGELAMDSFRRSLEIEKGMDNPVVGHFEFPCSQNMASS